MRILWERVVYHHRNRRVVQISLNIIISQHTAYLGDVERSVPYGYTVRVVKSLVNNYDLISFVVLIFVQNGVNPPRSSGANKQCAVRA